MMFHSCNLGSKADKILSQIGIYHLKQLSIYSDTLSNKDIKALVKLQFNLSSLTLSNLNITSDVIKILQKLFSPKISNFGIIFQKGFNYQLLFKNMTFFNNLNAGLCPFRF